MSSPITSINNSTPPTPAPTYSSNGTQVLTQQDFLQIMVAQFSNQDPLSDSSDSGATSYVNQLMSMSNLTTMQTMSGQQAQQLVETLPGATVEISDNGTASSGVVQTARVDATTGAVYFTVNGKEYPSSDIYSVDQTAAQAAAGTAAAAAGNN